MAHLNQRKILKLRKNLCVSQGCAANLPSEVKTFSKSLGSISLTHRCNKPLLCPCRLRLSETIWEVSRKLWFDMHMGSLQEEYLVNRRHTCGRVFPTNDQKKKKIVVNRLRQFIWLKLSQGTESLLLIGKELIAEVDVYDSYPQQAF